MKQEIYSPPNEGERYQNPWWLPILAVFLAASALLLGRFLADHYVKPALPKESVLAAQLQSEEGQDLLQLASDRSPLQGCLPVMAMCGARASLDSQ